MTKKILLLGSGELGKEFTIAAQRLGQTVVACDAYAGAPAMQVADAAEVFDMLDGTALETVVERHRPDIIVPEIEAIRTERLYDFERAGIQVVPSARAVNFTMNRKAIRDLAAKELGLRTARYFYARTLDELRDAADRIGYPCVVKPLMSSSGKGQSVVKSPGDVEHAWRYGCEGSRGDIRELIVEEFIRFDSEITLLTVTQRHGPTLFCPPIGHVQQGGDYRESFQSPRIAPEHLHEAQRMAAAVTGALTGAGLWGVEFFLSHEHGVYFSELSPRPHDTGMVTLAGTQNLNEFELHLRAVLGIPIPEITFERPGASAVILSPVASASAPRYEGIERAAAADAHLDVRIFGKPSAREGRRMGVVVGYDAPGCDLEALRRRVKAAAAEVRVELPE
ncbi:formate-dependent phosphoribosylglycinamide formyltransferase [Alistipes dispar]|uniref:formate-dependent phosphoribosylglycinamide formyltransferase n=1 Tax=Alistipes dispar TaxID=2585119 RepID=UPI003AB4BA73